MLVFMTIHSHGVMVVKEHLNLLLLLILVLVTMLVQVTPLTGELVMLP
jgi:hypothetical protein